MMTEKKAEALDLLLKLAELRVFEAPIDVFETVAAESETYDELTAGLEAALVLYHITGNWAKRDEIWEEEEEEDDD